jgi:hypothetical protein
MASIIYSISGEQFSSSNVEKKNYGASRFLSFVVKIFYYFPLDFQKLIFFICRKIRRSQRHRCMIGEIIYSCHVGKTARNPRITFQGSVTKGRGGLSSLFTVRRWKKQHSPATFYWEKGSILSKRKGFLPSWFLYICNYFLFHSTFVFSDVRSFRHSFQYFSPLYIPP